MFNQIKEIHTTICVLMNLLVNSVFLYFKGKQTVAQIQYSVSNLFANYKYFGRDMYRILVALQSYFK